MSIVLFIFTVFLTSNICINALKLNKHAHRFHHKHKGLTEDTDRFQRLQTFFKLLKNDNAEAFPSPPNLEHDSAPFANSLLKSQGYSIPSPTSPPILEHDIVPSANLEQGSVSSANSDEDKNNEASTPTPSQLTETDLATTDSAALARIHLKKQILLPLIMSRLHQIKNQHASTTSSVAPSVGTVNVAGTILAVGAKIPILKNDGQTDGNSTLTVGNLIGHHIKGKLIDDEVLWTGIALGAVVAIFLFLIGMATFKLVQYLRRKHGVSLKDLSLCNLREHKLDKNPMYVRLSQLHDPKTGNHYIVTVLDESQNASNEWSSEEEIFNVSALKGIGSNTNSPVINVTSTPIKGTPVKAAWKR